MTAKMFTLSNYTYPAAKNQAGNFKKQNPPKSEDFAFAYLQFCYAKYLFV